MRAKVSTCLVMVALLTGGCGGSELELILLLQACPGYMNSMMETVRTEYPPPTEVPGELRGIVENRSSYVADGNHPLANVVTGTVLDDLSSLEGCWATVERETLFKFLTGEPVEIEKVRVLCFDPVNRRATQDQWVDRAFVDDTGKLFCPPFDAASALSDKAGFVSIEYTYDVIRDGMILLEGIDGNGGQIEADGTITFNAGSAMSVSINGYGSFPMLMTLQGDYLKTREGGFEPDELVIGEDEESARLWFRVK